MKIRIADKHLGEIVITVNTDISKSAEYTIKSLSMLQMMCMNKDDSPEKFASFIDIVKEAVDKANILYRGVENEATDPTGHLGN